MPVVLNEDFRKGAESLLQNVAIGGGVKAYIKEFLRICDDHDCEAEDEAVEMSPEFTDAIETV